MERKTYRPSPEEMKKAEESMTDEQRRLSREREKGLMTPKGKFFNEARNTLLLDLDKKSVDLGSLREMADKNGFDPRSEFHITILGNKNGGEVRKALKAMPEVEGQNALSQIKSLVKNTDWRFALEPQRYHISKEYVSLDPKNKGAESRERRESYIQMVYLPGMKIFYDKLNSILGSDLEAPPAHITLYTKSDAEQSSRTGIGINTQAEFLEMNPEPIT